MSVLNPSPNARLAFGAVFGIGATALAGYAGFKAWQADRTEAQTRELHEAALSEHAREHAQFDAEILAIRTTMLAESEVVFATGLPLLHRFNIDAGELANHPLPEALRFIKSVPALPQLKLEQPRRPPAISPKQEVNLLMSPRLPDQSAETYRANKVLNLSMVLVARAQTAVAKADARLDAAHAQRTEIEQLQVRLKRVASDMAVTVRRARDDSLPKVQRYAELIRNDFIAPCWRMAADRSRRSELADGELRALRNLGVGLTALADFTHREILL